MEPVTRDLDSIRVLWRKPETLCLYGIPYDMRPGQSPNDLYRAGNTEGWVYLGSPGWASINARDEQERIEQWLDSLVLVPQWPMEWCRVELRS